MVRRFKVDMTKREPWMPLWPERVELRGLRWFAPYDDGAADVFDSLAELQKNFNMPQFGVLVEE